MPSIRIHCTLKYQVELASSFYFSIVAARNEHQIVREETLTITPNPVYEMVPYETGGHQLIRLDAAPGPLEIVYDTLIDIHPSYQDPSALNEIPFGKLPSEVLRYLNPSRYCESDKLSGFVTRVFAQTPEGYLRVVAVSDWVRNNLAYVAGSTDASSSAADVLLQRAGVCRDFAHVSISLCRALGIPARYVTGYGVGVEPQDFHGFFEAFLDGDWYLFDPTGMSAANSLVRIGSGRDAADAPFATFVGSALLIDKTISVLPADGNIVPSVSATSTA